MWDRATKCVKTGFGGKTQLSRFGARVRITRDPLDFTFGRLSDLAQLQIAAIGREGEMICKKYFSV